MDFIIKIDMFGQPIGFEDNNSTKYKTASGALFTFIVIAACSIIGFLFGQEVYQRKESNTRLSKNYVSNSTISINDNLVIFGIVSGVRGLVVPNPLDYFDFHAEFNSFDEKNIITKRNIDLKSCDKDKIESQYKNKASFNVLDGSLCFKEEDNIFFRNKFTKIDSDYIYVSIYPCNPLVRKCASDLDSLLKNFYFFTSTINSYVDINSYEQPIKYYFDNYVVLNSVDFFKKAYLSITNNTIVSDNGWLLEEKVEFKYAQLVDFKIETMMYYPGVTPVCAFNFDSPNIVDNINRSYMKVQDLLAKVGGLINASIILMKLLTFHYIRFQYLMNLIDLSIRKENKHKEINAGEESIQRINKAQVNNFTKKTSNKKENQKEKEVESNNSNKDKNQKLALENNIELKREDIKADFHQIKISYISYIIKLISFNVKSLEISKHMIIVQKKLSLNTMIKLMNKYYNE